MEQLVLERQTGHGSNGHGQPTISLWLERQCRSDRLSLRKAAAKIGVSHNTVASIINGERPSPGTVAKLARAFADTGPHQRGALEDFLLNLAGYRSERAEGKVNEPLARLMDKLANFTPEELEVTEQFADFIGRVGATAWRK